VVRALENVNMTGSVCIPCLPCAHADIRVLSALTVLSNSFLQFERRHGG